MDREEARLHFNSLVKILIERLSNIQQADMTEATATATAYFCVGGKYVIATMCSKTNFEQWLQEYNAELRRQHRSLHENCEGYHQ